MLQELSTGIMIFVGASLTVVLHSAGSKLIYDLELRAAARRGWPPWRRSRESVTLGGASRMAWLISAWLYTLSVCALGVGLVNALGR